MLYNGKDKRMIFHNKQNLDDLKEIIKNYANKNCFFMAQLK